MRISDWSSDVCSSDLEGDDERPDHCKVEINAHRSPPHGRAAGDLDLHPGSASAPALCRQSGSDPCRRASRHIRPCAVGCASGEECTRRPHRSEEHTSELQSLMRISYAVFCLKKKHIKITRNTKHHNIS